MDITFRLSQSFLPFKMLQSLPPCLNLMDEDFWKLPDDISGATRWEGPPCQNHGLEVGCMPSGVSIWGFI